MTDERARKRRRPLIRVFVSSTFSDLKLERDALQQRVFPKLEQRCLAEGFQFQAIDLRWGVSTEAGLDHRTMRICFEELRRSQEVSPEPNFLILLGNRYGWRPLPEEISEEEFRELNKAASDDDERRVLRDWYRCDSNAVPPVHLLRPRTDSPDGQDYTKEADPTGNQRDTSAWIHVQKVLWNIVNRAFPANRLQDRFMSAAASGGIPSIVRFQASATEQEIWAGALSVPNAEHHVLAFFRDITNRDEFSPVDVKDFFDLTESKEFDDDAKTWQMTLKEAIRTRLGNDAVAPLPWTQLKQHKGKIAVDGSEDEIQQFCDSVETRLWTIIDRQIQQYWRSDSKGGTPDVSSGESTPARHSARELEIEIDEQIRFGTERAPQDGYIGRETESARIREYLADDNRQPLVVFGPSGTGKTALLAHVAVPHVTPQGQPIPVGHPLTIVRFLGTTPASSTLRALVTSLCRQLRQHFPLELELPTDLYELQQEFHEQLARATSERPIHLFLDALDQLDDADGGPQLGWLRIGPSLSLPAHVKLVVSCLSDAGDAAAGLPFRRLSQGDILRNGVELQELTPDEAVRLLLGHWLKSRPAPDDAPTDDLGRPRRTVSEEQRKVLEQQIRRPEASECRRPLYLKILFEEARLWHGYAAPPQQLPDKVEGLLKQLVDRLSLKVNHGPLLIERVLGYIAAARRGLSETEILEVLFADRDFRRSIVRSSLMNQHRMSRRPRRIPIAIWSRLRFDLHPYLTERSAPGGNVLTLYHRQVAEWVSRRFVDNADWPPSRALAAFFGKQGNYLESLDEYGRRATQIASTPRRGNVRKLDEVPWLLLKAEHWNELVATLGNLDFVIAKAGSGLSYDLLRDFDDSLAAMPAPMRSSAILKQLRHLLWRDAAVLHRIPALALQQILLDLGRFARPDPGLERQSRQLLDTAHAAGILLAEVSVPEFATSPSGQGIADAVEVVAALPQSILIWRRGGCWIEVNEVGAQIAEGHGPAAPFAYLAASGRSLAGISAQFVLVWRSWPDEPPKNLRHSVALEKLAWSADSNSLLVVGREGAWWLYRYASDAGAWHEDASGNSAGRVVEAWIDGGNVPVLISVDGRLRRKHAEGYADTILINGEATCATHDSQRSTVFIASADNTLCAVSTSGTPQWNKRLPAPARRLVFCQDAEEPSLLAALANGSLLCCRARDGSEERIVSVGPHALTEVVPFPSGMSAIVRDYTGDATLVSLGPADGDLAARDLPAHGRIRAVHWDETTRSMACVDDDGTRVDILRHAGTWKTQKLTSVPSPAGKCQFLPDRRLLSIQSVLSKNRVFQSAADGRRLKAVWPRWRLTFEPFRTLSAFGVTPDGAHCAFAIEQPGAGGVSVRMFSTAPCSERHRFELSDRIVCGIAPANGLRRVLLRFNKLHSAPVLWTRGGMVELPIDGGTNPSNLQVGDHRSLTDISVNAEGTRYLAIDRHGDVWQFDHPENGLPVHRQIATGTDACDLSSDGSLAVVLCGHRLLTVLQLRENRDPLSLCSLCAPWDVEVMRIIPESRHLLLGGRGAVTACRVPPPRTADGRM
jgi:hypothetical protein